MPSISLGRDCTISIGGSPLTSVRSATLTGTRGEIECPLFGSQSVLVFPAQTTYTLEVEVIGQEDAATLTALLSNIDTPATLGGSNVSGKFHLFSLSAAEPLDDVVAYTAVFKGSL
jgi:hypothetical protein